MVARCANPACSSACHRPEEGKLFRVDIEIANKAGTTEQNTAYVWLCSRCARVMNPRIEVAGDTVRVLLSAVHQRWSGGRSMAATVN